jgi:hypothetical protein
MFKKFEKVLVLGIGAYCLASGYTYALALLCALESYSLFKTAKQNRN